MAITVVTQDLVNYPGITKNVTVDQTQIVPTGYEGDEQFVVTVSTTAYSDNTNRTAIQTVYIMDVNAGWCKSSGFAGTNGKFDLDASSCNLKVRLDATASGTDNNGYYTITLAHESGDFISGESIADDMEEKIRDLTMQTADTGFSLSYKNASVEFRDGQFWVVSGSVGQYFTGANRTSVDIKAAGSNDASAKLGFNLKQTSEALAGLTTREALLGANYGTNTTPMTVGAGTGVVAGDCMLITDGTNVDYFTALSGTTDTSVIVPTTVNNSYRGIVNDYTTAAGAKIQILREQDPDADPTAWYTDIDSVVRFGVKSIINQIDYSS